MEPGLRSARERVIQTLWFEGVGLVLVAPSYAFVTASPVGESVAVVGAVSMVVAVWGALYNMLFDIVEGRRTGRVASERPHALRTAHAVGLEASAVDVSCPVIWAMTTLGWWDALVADLGLTVAYVVYGYAFHWVFDRLRPVAQGVDIAADPRPR
jgi:uncharacterized membrane protein